MKEYYVLILPENPDHATRELNYYALKGWRAVSCFTKDSGFGIALWAVLERDNDAPA